MVTVEIKTAFGRKYGHSTNTEPVLYVFKLEAVGNHADVEEFKKCVIWAMLAPEKEADNE